jgi:hypothetical protein
MAARQQHMCTQSEQRLERQLSCQHLLHKQTNIYFTTKHTNKPNKTNKLHNQTNQTNKTNKQTKQTSQPNKTNKLEKETFTSQPKRQNKQSKPRAYGHYEL